MVALDDLIKSTLSDLDITSCANNERPAAEAEVAAIESLADRVWGDNVASDETDTPGINELDHLLDRIAMSLGEDFNADHLPDGTVESLTRELADHLQVQLKSLAGESGDHDPTFEEVSKLVRDICGGDSDIAESAMTILRQP